MDRRKKMPKKKKEEKKLSYAQEIVQKRYPDERWAVIEGFNGRYQISSYGRICAMVSAGRKKAKRRRILNVYGDVFSPLDVRVVLTTPEREKKKFLVRTLIRKYFPECYVEKDYTLAKDKEYCIVYSYDTFKKTKKYYRTVQDFCDEYHISQDKAYRILRGMDLPWQNQKLYYTEYYNSFRTFIKDFDFLKKK